MQACNPRRPLGVARPSLRPLGAGRGLQTNAARTPAVSQTDDIGSLFRDALDWNKKTQVRMDLP